MSDSVLSSPPPHSRSRPLDLHPDNVQRRRSNSGFYTPRSPGSRSRRASSSVAAGERSQVALRHAAFEPGATQETIKEYIYTLLESHGDTAASWEKGVRVAEIYRNKQLRQGGETTTLRPSDQGFLERVEKSSEHYMNVIEQAKGLLEAQREASEDRRDAVSRAWHQYCCRYHAALHDLWLEVSLIYRRTERLLVGSIPHDPYTPSKFKRTADGGRRSRATSVHSRAPSRSHSVASRRASQAPNADGTLTVVDASPLAKMRRSSSHGGTTPRPSLSASPGQSPSSVRRGSEIVRPGINGRLSQVSLMHLTIAADDPPSTTPSGRPLHPNTVVPHTLIGSPYDEKTAYGRLSPRRFDPTRTAAEVLVWEDNATQLGRDDHDDTARRFSEMEEELVQEGEAEALVPFTKENGAVRCSSEAPSSQLLTQSALEGRRCSTARRSSLSCRRASQLPPPEEDIMPQVATYRSHRGPSPVAIEHPVTPERRQELLEQIDAFSKHAESLEKAHLKAARESFVELYGPQRGLRQYSNWIDDLALQALRNRRQN